MEKNPLTSNQTASETQLATAEHLFSNVFTLTPSEVSKASPQLLSMFFSAASKPILEQSKTHGCGLKVTVESVQQITEGK